ncbi:hypothetical protein MFM001_46490 [Mycobacterium sp. MFM001]|nr:hypothetical protein MFM001_46490 [Mycobacterium sp. MFM001]
MPEIVERQLDVRVVDRPLENLAINFEKRGSDWLGLRHHVPDRLFKHIRFYGPADYSECDDVPLRIEATRFLGQPNVELPPGERKRPVIKFHRTP